MPVADGAHATSTEPLRKLTMKTTKTKGKVPTNESLTLIDLAGAYLRLQTTVDAALGCASANAAALQILIESHPNPAKLQRDLPAILKSFRERSANHSQAWKTYFEGTASEIEATVSLAVDAKIEAARQLAAMQTTGGRH